MLDFFQNMIQEICEERQIAYHFLSKGWMMKLEKDGKVGFIVGSKFSINSDTSSRVASDKYATFCVLKDANIPVIEHKIQFHPQYRKGFTSDLDNKKAILEYYKKSENKIVVKSNAGFAGKEVFLCTRPNEIFKNMKKVFQRNDSLSICPFYEISTEYRVIMLDGECQLLFGKKAAEGNWKFNLSQGASVVNIEDVTLQEELIQIAQKTVDALKIRFASVDIIQLKTGELKVIEVNSSVTIHQYTKYVENGREIAKRIYAKTIEKMLQ